MGFMDSIGRWFTEGQAQDDTPLVGRNEPCWCGSGKKYKKCHLDSDELKKSSRRKINCGTS